MFVYTFPGPSNRRLDGLQLTVGPDGALVRFTSKGAAANAIGRATTSGSISLFGAPLDDPRDIVTGPDGKL